MGTEIKFCEITFVKSFFSSVIPVPIMTLDNMRGIKLEFDPLLTHVRVEGAYAPNNAENRTKNGKADVSVERISSSLLLTTSSLELLLLDVANFADGNLY